MPRLRRGINRRTPQGPASPSIETPALLEYLHTRTGKLSPTLLESYLQCPFQYFGSRLLRLKTAPPRPEERLDFLTQELNREANTITSKTGNMVVKENALEIKSEIEKIREQVQNVE